MLNNNILSFPDPDGNIISDDNIKTNFISANHLIPYNLYKSYIKDYIKKNFFELTKNDLLNKGNNYTYLKEYCKQYFFHYLDTSLIMH